MLQSFILIHELFVMFSHLFQLRKGSNWAAWWAPSVQSRLIPHSITMLFTLNTDSFISTFHHASYPLWEIIERSHSVSGILSWKLDWCILKLDQLSGLFVCFCFCLKQRGVFHKPQNENFKYRTHTSLRRRNSSSPTAGRREGSQILWSVNTKHQSRRNEKWT